MPGGCLKVVKGFFGRFWEGFWKVLGIWRAWGKVFGRFLEGFGGGWPGGFLDGFWRVFQVLLVYQTLGGAHHCKGTGPWTGPQTGTRAGH